MPETTKTYADRLTKSSAVFFIPSGAFYFTAFYFTAFNAASYSGSWFISGTSSV